MSDFSDLPPGFQVIVGGSSFDPLEAISRLPASITSGFRTVAHNRAVGGVPNSRHLDGDAVDLVPHGVGMGDLHRMGSELAARWGVPGARALNEGDHVHLQLPGWGRAPGSPPAAPAAPEAAQDAPGDLPSGYTVISSAPPAAPAPPPAVPTPQEKADAAALLGKPQGTAPGFSSPPMLHGPAPALPAAPMPRAPLRPLPGGLIPSDARQGRAVEPVAPLPSNLSYQAEHSPTKDAQLQAALDRGASAAQLIEMAKGLGLEFDHGRLTVLREAVNYRNAGGKGARIAPEALPGATAPGPGSNEAPADYYRRMSGGQTIGGPYTPEHPQGDTFRAQTEKVFRDLGYTDADQRADTAGLLPVIGGGLAWDEAKRDFRTGHYGGATYQAVMAGLGMLPVGPGGEIKAGAHVVDSLALRVAATAGGEAPSIARAGEVLAGTVSDAVMAGGSVTLHGVGESRQIIGTNAAGELVDRTGATVHPDEIARYMIEAPKGSNPRLEVNIPHPNERAAVAAAGRQAQPEAAGAGRLPGDVPDTRGQGVFYHGARGEVPNLTEGYYNPANIYGGIETFYTTDAADIAKGYGRRKDAARIYSTTERQPVKFYDMEAPQPQEHFEQLFGVKPDDLGLVPMSIEEAAAANGGKANLRQVMDEIRGNSAGEGVSRDEVQESFDTAIHNLRQGGFGGMTHTGGLKTGRQPHSVRIYFDAPNQLALRDVTPLPEAVASDLPREAGNESQFLGGGSGRPPAPPEDPPSGGGGDLPAAPRQRDYLDMPPGFTVLSAGYHLDGMPGNESGLGFTGRMNEPRSAEEMAALARGAQPEHFAAPPSSLARTEADFARANPDTFRPVDAPDVPGRAPARPATFSDALKAHLAQESKAKGMPVRVDAEQAIDAGVSADLVYLNPNVADKSKLRLRYPSLFGTRYGKMSSKQQHLVSLDMGNVDPAAWGFDHKVGQRLAPEDVGDLLRRSLEGDPSAFERGAAFDAWTAHEEAGAQRAEFEGRFPDGPPVERKGEGLGLDDLRANEPPATSYEDLIGSGKSRVANINIANLDTRADIQRALEATEAHFGGFDAARRGVVSHAETEALASEAGMTVDDLLRRRHGQALNAQQALAARQILAKSSEELTAMARNMANWTDEERAQFAEHLLRHAAIYEQVTGATAEAGRALESFKIGASSKAVHGTIHRLSAASQRGGVNVDDVARFIVDLHKSGVGPGGVNRFALEAARPATKMDKLLEVFYNSILSAPSTHAINMLGNTVSTTLSVPEYALAAVLGRLHGGDRVFGAEVGGYVAGLLHGTGKGLDAFMSTLRTGVPADSVTKLDTLRREAIGGIAGKVIRTPSRFLSAEDELFKGVARQGAIGRLAARQAAREGLTGDVLARRAADLAANPSEPMLAQARDFARYMTFQRDPGRLGRALQGWTDDYPALKFLIPFIRTQENLMKFAAERSPLALLMPTVRADLKAGGAKRDLAMAKIALGSMAGFVAYEAARRGFLTGGEPRDASMRDTLHQAGWQPYSVKLGDRYVSYRRLDPLSLTISVAADFATYDKYMTPKERDQGAAVLAQMMSRNLSNSFWMESVSNLMKLIGDPLHEAPNTAANIVGALAVPNIIAQPTASMDPVQRRQSVRDENWFRGAAMTILNRVKGRIPGLRQTLPVRTDAFGAPMKNDGRLGPDFLSPFQQNLRNSDPAYQSLIDEGLMVDQPGKTVGRVPLTERQHADYTRLSGKYISDDLAAVEDSPEWRGLSAAERKVRFEDMKRNARADARADLGLEDLRSNPPSDLPPGFTVLHAPPSAPAAQPR